jgi:hypothetical protein
MVNRVNHVLRKLMSKVRHLEPFLRRAANLTEYTIRSTGRGNFFSLTVEWKGGKQTFHYDASMVQVAQRHCLRDHGQYLLQKIQHAQGVA